MPLVPTGLGGAFVDRIRDRVQNALGVNPVAPTSAPGAPSAPMSGPSQANQLFTPNQPGQPSAPQLQQPQDQSFTQRIKDRVRRELGLEPPQPPQEPQQPVNRGPPRSLAEVKQRIQEAARQMPPVLLRMLYNGFWRPVESYSYRYRDADDPHIPLFYGYCGKDDQIEAFKLKKVQDLQVTNQPYSPRWTIEI